MTQHTPYELIGKEEGVRSLTDAFYAAMDKLPEAAPIRGMHAQSLAPMRQKLFEYLNGWLGGEHLYREKYGGICLTEPHSHFAIGADERDQWMACWESALDAIDAPEELRSMVAEPMLRLANFMTNS